MFTPSETFELIFLLLGWWLDGERRALVVVVPVCQNLSSNSTRERVGGGRASTSAEGKGGRRQRYVEEYYGTAGSLVLSRFALVTRGIHQMFISMRIYFALFEYANTRQRRILGISSASPLLSLPLRFMFCTELF